MNKKHLWVARMLRVGSLLIALAMGYLLGMMFAPQPDQVAEAPAQHDPETLTQKERRPKAPALLSGTELVKQLISQNLGERSFPFPAIIQASSGQALVAVEPTDPVAKGVMTAIQAAADSLCQRHSQPTSPIHGLSRINEASRHFEDGLAELLNQEPELSCQVPTNAKGRQQRSGYPDLMITHEPSGRIFYLDPKLFEQGSETSSLRTFYFTAKAGDTKIQHSAHHLLLGIRHDGNDGAWAFTGWSLVDLANLQVRLKAEFQASNRDLYPEGHALLRSEPTPKE